MSRQAIENQNSGNGHWTRMDPIGQGGSARRKQPGRDFGRRMARGGVSGLPGDLECECAWRHGAWITRGILHSLG